MQLSFFSDDLVDKKFFIDVFAEVVSDTKGTKMKLYTIDGREYPSNMGISCRQTIINAFPEGTIYKMDVRLIRRKNAKPYFLALKQKNIGRAIEFFEYNMKVQNGFDFKFNQQKPTKKINVKSQPRATSASFETF